MTNQHSSIVGLSMQRHTSMAPTAIHMLTVIANGINLSGLEFRISLQETKKGIIAIIGKRLKSSTILRRDIITISMVAGK